jgi:hypothetical protein
MNDAVREMLKRYPAATSEQYKNALKEIIQEIALLGLSRAKMFEHAAFYGGTALRILYGLDRFSEDLDFSLLCPNPAFDIEPYCASVRDELTAFGFSVSVEKKQKPITGKIESAFIKANTLEHLILIEDVRNPRSGTHANEVLKVKFEIDTDPPKGASYDVQFCNQPIPFSVKLYDRASMLAGKMHAMLFRDYRGKNVKGRDIYDFIWLSTRHSRLNIAHLEMRMRQSGNWESTEPLSPQALRELVRARTETIDLEAAKDDVRRFISHPAAVDAWSPQLIMHAFDSISFT